MKTSSTWHSEKISAAQRHAARAKENSAMQRAPRSAPTDAPENKSAKEKKSGTVKARVDEKIECDGFDSFKVKLKKKIKLKI
jgi:hypothetical protein